MMFFVMAQIGGLYSFLKMVFGSIINAIQYKMMLIEVVNKYNHRRVEDSIKRKKTKKLEKALHNQKKKINLNSPPEDSKMNDGGEEEYNLHPENQANAKKSKHYAYNDIEENMSRLEVRQNIADYNYADLFYQSICCFKTKPGNMQTSEESLGTRHDQFLKDLDRFKKEIDVISLISNIKDLKHAVNDAYTEIEKVKNQQSSDPQSEKESTNAVSTNKLDIRSSLFDPSQLKYSFNEPVAKKPIENAIYEKPDESVDFEIVSDMNKVSFLIH